MTCYTQKCVPPFRPNARSNRCSHFWAGPYIAFSSKMKIINNMIVSQKVSLVNERPFIFVVYLEIEVPLIFTPMIHIFTRLLLILSVPCEMPHPLLWQFIIVKAHIKYAYGWRICIYVLLLYFFSLLLSYSHSLSLSVCFSLAISLQICSICILHQHITSFTFWRYLVYFIP